MTRNDRAALKLALDQYRGRDADVANWIRATQREEGSFYVARHAAVCCQRKNLRLRPWQVMPIYIVDPDDPDAGQYHRDDPGLASDGRREAAKLLKKMLALGISKFHPDPMAAIEEAEKQAAKAP